jgi:LysR family transcriptional regulator, hydrogen peroxide-inducible genes activator
METHQLRYFVAAADTGRITQAARVCNVSQPSLSVQLKKLEEELGGPIFERTRKGVRLTSRGVLLLPRAREILRQIGEAHKEADSLDGLKSGSVVLGCLPTTGARLLPGILAAFRKLHPQIQVNLREESSPGLALLLEQGEADLGILDEAGLNQNLEYETLFKEDLLVAMPPKHILARRDRVSLKSLAEEPFILMKSGHGFRKIVLDLLLKSGVKPRVVFESSEIETVQTLVAIGLGVSIVPRMVIRSPGPAYVGISQSGAFRTLILAWRKGGILSPAAEKMKTMIEKTGYD